MRIRSLGYNPESDELDLLIDAEQPVPAEAVPVDAGVFIRREWRTGQVVGAFIRGYSHLARRLHTGEPIPDEMAQAVELSEVFHAIVAWLRRTDDLSQLLIHHLGVLPQQHELVEALLDLHAYAVVDV